MSNLLKSEIREYNGRPTIFINNEAYSPVIYALTDCPGGRLSYEEIPGTSIQGFVDIGFKLFQLDIWLDDMWSKGDVFDITMARNQIKGITDRCPDAKVFLRYHTTPPKWWNLKNLDELVDFADQPVGPEKKLPGFQRYLIQDLSAVYRHSFASKKWLNDSSRMLKRFLNELSKTEEGASLAGLQPATGVYGEHHYWAFMEHEPDTGLRMNEAFREYLKDKYITVDNLKSAWSNNLVDFDSALVPDIPARLGNLDGIFRDPQKERNVIDYYSCQHQLVADSVVHFCKLIKDNWPSQIITGAFYGYYISVFGRSAAGGHLSEQTILESPYIDCLCGPQGYDKNLRNLGGSGSSRGMLESAMLHGKLWLDEMDQPVHTGTVMGGMPVYPTYESKQILRRNSLFPITHGGGLWYYDFGPHNYSGWWLHSEYKIEITKLKNIIDSKMTKNYDNPAQTLLVFDTTVFKHTSINSRLDPFTDAACINNALPMAQKSGAALDTIYLSDIENIDPDKYKCIVFMNSFVLTPAQKKFIKGTLYKNSRHIVWFYAPGYIDGDHASVDNISDITELDIEKITVNSVPAITHNRISYDMYPVYDRLYKTPSEYPTIDLFIEKGSGQPLLIENKKVNYTIWFSSIPFTIPEIFTYVFKKAGVHIFCDSADSLTAGSDILSVHTEKGGHRIITLPNGNLIDTVLTPAETILIDYTTGEILLRG
ncbi:MAG: beta-galactosidase [Clostridiales bacterium]|nr:beta-galactosidase [Clostridiales bacterium]